jgi:PAS domain S-box-containing protein
VDTERVACICLYDSENGSHSEVLAAVSTHPSLVIRGFVCRNYFYTPPEEFAQTGGCLPEAKQLLEKMLDIQICQISLADEDSGETNAVLEEEVARRERAERALNETFAHHSEVLDGLEDGICLIDLDHKVLLTNHVFERFREACGGRGTSKGLSLAQIWPLRVEDVNSSCDRAVWTGGTQRMRLVHLWDEVVVWYDLRIVPMVRSGRPDRILLVLHDSTELHQARLALAEIRRGLELAPGIENEPSLRWERLLATLEHSPLPLFVQGRDGCVLYANQACGSMVGYSLEEMVGKSTSKLIMPDPMDFLNLERRTLLEGEEVSLRVDARHKDGRSLPCHLRMFYLDSGSGRLLALLTKRVERGIGQMTDVP